MVSLSGKLWGEGENQKEEKGFFKGEEVFWRKGIRGDKFCSGLAGV
jgi:hypothetical protein